jgi:hypothetical protein
MTWSGSWQTATGCRGFSDAEAESAVAKALVAFLIVVVLLFVVPSMVPGLVAATGPLLLVAAAVAAVLFVPGLRRFALAVLVIGAIGAYAVSTLSSGFQAARARVAAAAVVPGMSFEGMFRAYLAEDWRPFAAGTPWWTFGQGTKPCCIRAGDVQQGQLGDCWLLAAMAAVANTNPIAIRDAIQANGDGTYTVRLFLAQNGQLVPKGIRVAPAFPEYRTTLYQRLTWDTRFAYAQPGDVSDEAWVMLIEKAAAAALHNGDYTKLDNGNGFDGLQMLTGRPVTALEPRRLTPDALAARLTSLERAGVPVITGTFASNKIVESGPNPLLVGKDASLNQQHMYYFLHFDPATRRVTVGNQHQREKTNVLTLQEFQFAFAGLYYNDFRASGDGCTCP